MAGYLLALACGMGLATWSKVPKEREASSPNAARRTNAPNSPLPTAATAERGAVPNITTKSWRQAWKILQDKPRAERERLAPLLIAGWMKVDLASALDAALDCRDSTVSLDLFQPVFDEDPENFLHCLRDERFALNTAAARAWWIRAMTQRDPESLLATARSLGPIDQQNAIRSACEAMKGDPERIWKALDGMATAPDSISQRKQWEFAAKAMAELMNPDELILHLSDIKGIAGDVMISHAMVRLMEKTDYQGARQTYDQLPADLKPQIVKAALDNPGNNASAFLAAIDEVLDTPQWDALQSSVAVNLHEMPKGGNQQETLLAWASKLPEREDTMDLFRVAVRTFMSGQPAEAREWIAEQPAGWKQQNALAAYVQTALFARDDVDGAQWAFQQISDLRFRSEAEDFFARHAEQKARK